jgi:hypothetical protein
VSEVVGLGRIVGFGLHRVLYSHMTEMQQMTQQLLANQRRTEAKLHEIRGEIPCIRSVRGYLKRDDDLTNVRRRYVWNGRS